MKKLQISCFLLLVGFSTSLFAIASEITLNFQGVLREHKKYEPLLLKANSNITVKCETPLAKEFSGKVDVYSVSYSGFKTCNVTGGKLLGSFYCGSNHHHNTKPLDFANKEAETYYLIGFARKKNERTKRVLTSGTCKTHGISKAKLILHFCDPVITQGGKACTMKSCPLSLGLGDGRIRDEQISASSELDDIHAAKQGRASLISSSHDSPWCAAPTFDLRSQYLQVDLLSIHTVSAVSTQGAVTENSWVSSYLVHYSLDGTEWIVVTDKGGEIKEFKGNMDQSSLVRHWLKPHYHARFVRFVPLSWVGQRCMRVELHGCKKADLSLEKLSGNLKNAPRPCEAAHCASIPYSTCFMYSDKPLCKCVQSCALDLGKVCGTDGLTYQNECEMKKTACLSKKQIRISKRQACSEAVTCKRKCSAPYSRCVNRQGTEEICECIHECPKELKHVCGSDKVTYGNKCLLQKAACENNKEITIIKTEPCEEPGVSCKTNCTAPYSRCVVHNGTEERCECAQGCPKVIQHVCGSDKMTYDNKCLLQKTACENNKQITIVKTEPCEEPAISCKTNCTAPYSRCVIHNETEDRCECAQGCPKVIQHVCGSDKVTYDNKCLLQKTACEKNKGITIAKIGRCQEAVAFHTGLCGTHICPPYSKCQSAGTCLCTKCAHDGKKVCGSDGKTYNDFCKLQKVACESNNTLTMDRKGPCEVCADKTCPPYANCVHSDSGDVCVCPDCFPRGGNVCGSDGRTYKHSCELKKHACKKNKRISIVSQSECAVPFRKDGKTEHSKEKKSTSSLKTFYICMIAVAVLGVAIALAMCLFQPAKSRTRRDRRNVSSRRERKNSFNSLHRKYRVHDKTEEGK